VTRASNPRRYRKVGSIAKHLAVYNFEGCIGGHDYPHCPKYRTHFNAIVGEVDLEESYYRAWRELAPSLAGAMCSYNSVNSVCQPSCPVTHPLVDSSVRASLSLTSHCNVPCRCRPVRTLRS
jgi:hypothetical protein